MTAVRRLMVLAALGGAASLLVVPSAAEDAKPPSPEEVAKKNTHAADIKLLAQAWQLADFGKEYKSPEAYIAAGSLILRLKAATNGEMAELQATPEVQDDKGNPIKDAKVESAQPESLADIADGFFESASQLGLELNLSKQVEALIKAAKSRSYQETGKRGAKGGPKVRAAVLAPHKSHVFHFAFAPYSLAVVGLRATAPVRMTMHSGGLQHFNQMVPIGEYSWIPRPPKGENATFTIHNPHNFAVQYRVFTN